MISEQVIHPFPHSSIMTARRQPPNLLRQLSLNINRDHTIECENNDKTLTPCSDKKCEFCPQAISRDTYITKNVTILKRNHKMTCKSRDLIYILICHGCGEEYVGETGTQLNLRTNLHRNQIKNPSYSCLKVSKHVHLCGNNKFSIFPLHKCFAQCHVYREELEAKYRKLIKPKLD